MNAIQNLSSKERVATALTGRCPDYAPAFPIYDIGYMMSSIGQDLREYYVCSNVRLINYLEENFLRHQVDGYYVYPGKRDAFFSACKIDRGEKIWTITDQNGEETYLLPDGKFCDENGVVIMELESEPLVNSLADIEKFRNDCAGVVRDNKWETNEYDLEKNNRFAPLSFLSAKYPEHHFAFNIHSPFIVPLSACGGYNEGLIKFVTEPELIVELMKNKGLFPVGTFLS